jgi:hypothetical protein
MHGYRFDSSHMQNSQRLQFRTHSQIAVLSIGRVRRVWMLYFAGRFAETTPPEKAINSEAPFALRMKNVLLPLLAGNIKSLAAACI